ncbi:unnamed protein product [Prorocentrum cordatum]|uniref:Uncharacterized protein n=1 Tax=Prorocentrum cordatum TaxID=2364126 RepID=A0ABN9VVZ6_9DINO|nr:unnamed protein product [Polarella glacialis]
MLTMLALSLFQESGEHFGFNARQGIASDFRASMWRTSSEIANQLRSALRKLLTAGLVAMAARRPVLLALCLAAAAAWLLGGALAPADVAQPQGFVAHSPALRAGGRGALANARSAPAGPAVVLQAAAWAPHRRCSRSTSTARPSIGAS